MSAASGFDAVAGLLAEIVEFGVDLDRRKFEVFVGANFGVRNAETVSDRVGHRQRERFLNVGGEKQPRQI